MIKLVRHLNGKKYNLAFLHNDNTPGNITLVTVDNKHAENKENVNKTKHVVTLEEIEKSNAGPDGIPEEPTTCCMSGCANCVWLDYAEKLNEYFKDGGERALKEINEKITDNNIKAFLLHELRMRKL